MKRFSLSLCVLLTGLFTPVFAKLDGAYMNEAGMTLKTPHAAWDEKGELPHKKILFIMQQTASREIIELVQRFPGFEYEVVLTATEKSIGADDIYNDPIAGLSTVDKLQELNAKLAKDYDLVVMANVDFSILPDEQKFRVLSMVENGTGLVRIQSLEHWRELRKLPYKKPYATPLPRPEWVAGSNGLPGTRPENFESRIFNAWQFGRGRIVEVDYGAGYRPGVGLTPYFDYTTDWFFLYETSQVFLAQVLYYSSGVELPAFSVRQDQGKFIVTSPEKTTVEGRIRQPDNSIIRDSLDFTGLPAGRYTADVLVRLDGRLVNFGAFPFTVESAFGAVSLETPRLVQDRGPFSATLKLASPAQDGYSAKVELMDAPYRNVWFSKTLPLAAGQKELSFDLENYRMPTIGGYLRCTVYDARGHAAHAEQPVVFPDYSLEDYLQLTWGQVGCTFNPAFGKRIIDRLGWNVSLQFFKEGDIENTLRNEKLCPYVCRIGLEAGPNNETRMLRKLWSEQKENMEQLATLNGDESFYHPLIRKLWGEALRRQAEYLKDLSPVLYNLGDENHYTYDAGFGESDKQPFADFLRQKYQTIENLNLEYGASYAGFGEVPHLRLDAAKKEGNLVAYNDHREYIEKMYVDMHHFLASEIKKVHPGARVGAEGSPPGNLEEMIKGLDFWGPYSGMQENEALRAFGADRVRTIWWGGYCAERSSYPYKLWEHLLQGAINGHAWFLINPALGETSHSGDLSEAEYLRQYMPHLDDLSRGLAQLLIKTPFPESGILFYYSHTSNSAAQADNRCVAPDASMNPLLRYCYQRGLGFNFVSPNTLERLKNARLLFLCGASSLSDKECAAILDFVKSGGTVLADANIAILNENLKKRTRNPLSELFGDLTFAQAKELEIQPYQSTSGTLALAGEKAHVVHGNPGLRLHQAGQGKTILLNASLSILENNSLPESSLNTFLDQVVKSAGVRPPAVIPDFSNALMVRPRQAGEFELLGALVQEKDLGKSFTAELPKEKYIYECRKGLVGKSDRLVFQFSKAPFRCFALFDREQQPPVITAPDQVAKGARALIKISGPSNPRERAYRITVTAPDGKEILHRSKTIYGKTEYPLDFAFNDLPGTYRISIEDAATGLHAQHEIEVK